MQNTKHPFIRYRLSGFQTLSAISLLDTQDDPLTLNFSKLSGCEGWIIDADWGDDGVAIVSCDWIDSACYSANMGGPTIGHTQRRIATRGEIVPFVRDWLRLLQGRNDLYAEQLQPHVYATPSLKIRGVTT